MCNGPITRVKGGGKRGKVKGGGKRGKVNGGGIRGKGVLVAFFLL
jgi:hypothetical protein